MNPPDAAAEPWPEPNLNIPPDDTPEGHRMRSRTTWLLARHDYLQGDSAEQVCARYGLKVSTLRDRSRREGWRRIDHPDPDPVEDEVDDSPVDCVALADEALMRVRAALRRRRPAEAASWMRVHDKLAALIATREERARRSARVDRERGGGAAADPLGGLMQELKSIQTIARSQTALGQAFADGALSQKRFDALSALNLKAAEALSGAPADPHPSHPDFSGDDDPEPDDPGDYEPPLF